MFYLIGILIAVIAIPIAFYFLRNKPKVNAKNKVILESVKQVPQYDPYLIYDCSIVEEKGDVEIRELAVTPIKAALPMLVGEWTIGNFGFEFDRSWCVLQKESNAICKAEEQMNFIKPQVHEIKKKFYLILQSENAQKLTIPILDDPSKMKDIKEVNGMLGYSEGEEAARWLSDVMKKEVYLFRLFNGAAISDMPGFVSENACPHDRKNFLHSKTSIHLNNINSLNDLNKRLQAKGERQLAPWHFKQNILIKGMEPYEEDTIYEFRIKNAIFRYLAPTIRCKRMTFDHEKKEYCKHGEPVTTLKEYRNDLKLGPMFGTYLVVNVIENKQFLKDLIKDKDALKEALDSVQGDGKMKISKGDKIYIRKRRVWSEKKEAL